jgi:hypothetical protein
LRQRTIIDTLAIVAINDEDDAVGVLVVVTPQGTNLATRTSRHCLSRLQCKPRANRKKAWRGEKKLAIPALTLSCPPTSHTVKEMFLYSTLSTLKPVKIRARTLQRADVRRNGQLNVADWGCNRADEKTELSNAPRTDGGDGRHDLTQLQLVQNRGLASGIETNHQNALLGLAEHTLPHTAESKSHVLR